MISDRKQRINNNWYYRETREVDSKLVHLPHTNKELPFNYFDEKSYQFISYYEKEIHLDQTAKRVFLKFDGVMTAFKLFVNEQEVTECRGGYIPHTIEVTHYVQKGATNKVLVEVDSTERHDIPPFGFVIDYLTYGGIYRDVYLCEMEETYIENIFYKYEVQALHEGKAHVVLTPEVTIDHEGMKGEYTLQIEIMGQQFEEVLKLQPGKQKYSVKAIELEEVEIWSLDIPHLHEVKATLEGEGITYDTATTKLGFRKLHIDHTGVYLNDNLIKLRGLNRHQAYPYVGYAMPKRVQQTDADILKNELGLNTVRTSHYPQSPYFLDRCDEIGLLVFEEIPGWQHIGREEAWRTQVLDDVRGMIERDWNHPSIFTWGVRINESWDDEELYTKTNELARSLDHTRPTCGVRYLENSQLLEDIYTMNDFVHEGGEEVLRTRQQVTGLENPVPYMITEFGGHIFPTKRYDQEARIVEHALRHGRVQAKARQGEDYLGAIGWCAFDYNTHYDFGSGDRICYHGVMDMFRMPKFAAHLYSSQMNPKDKVVLQPLTYWTRGEKDKGIVCPAYVCTNCDTVEVKLQGHTKGIFRRDEQTVDETLKGLKYPPIRVHIPDGEWGSSWEDASYIGYIDGQEVATYHFAKDPVVSDMIVEADEDTLYTHELDATRVCVQIVDRCGHFLPYLVASLSIETDEDIEVMGPDHIAFMGGVAAFWVRSKVTGQTGTRKIRLTSSVGLSKEIEIKLI